MRTDRKARADQSLQTGLNLQAAQFEPSEKIPLGLTIVPYALLSTRYDDNIFARSSNTESDTILGVTPGIDLTYLSPRTNFTFNYNITADKFARHSVLSSWNEAQEGYIGVNHWVTERFNAGIEGSYRLTHYPGELSSLSGLVISRTRATQATIQPEFIYEFSPITSLDVFYRRIRDGLGGPGYNRIGIASGTVTHKVTPRDTLQFRYQNRYYDFYNGESVTSNLALVGWTHALTRKASFVLGAGPRATEGSVVPELLARFNYRAGDKFYSLAYRRTQVLEFGGTNLTNSQRFTASFRFEPYRRWNIKVSPGYFHVYGPTVDANVYRLRFYAFYRFAGDWTIGLTEVYQLQHSHFTGVPGTSTIRRNIIGISLNWGLPIRGGNLEPQISIPLRGIESRRVPPPIPPRKFNAR